MEEKPLKVLVIEPDLGFTRQLKKLFAEAEKKHKQRFDLEYIEELSLGLERLAKGGIDIILLDLSSHEGTGLEALSRVYAKAKNTAIVVLIDKDKSGLAGGALYNGAMDCLLKDELDSKLLTHSLNLSLKQHQLYLLLTQAKEKIEIKEVQLEEMKKALDQIAIVAETDPQGRIIYVNDQFCQIAKYSREELLGKDDRIINSGYHPKEFWRQMWATIGRGEVWRGDVCSRAKDGSIYWVDATIVPFMGPDGKPEKYLTIRTVITERKQIDELKNKFVGTVSHELRTPLATIRNTMTLLLNSTTGPINDNQRKFLDMAKSNIDRLGRLIDDLLDISKLEAGKVEFKPVLVDFSAMLRETCAKWKTEIDKNCQSLECCLPDSAVNIYIDPDKLAQILDNLISNAIKFTPKQGKIDVVLKDRKDQIEVSVSDAGIGIAKEDLPKVFSRFQQFSRTPGPGYKGTGLGLAIVKELIEMLKGEIKVESELNKGSKFIFTLPKITAEEIFKEYVMNGFEKARTANRALSVLVMHVNHLGELKEEYGDEGVRGILGDLETTVKKNVRRDFVSVHKESSIVIILEETDKKGVLVVQKRIADAVEKYEFKPTTGRPRGILVTFGMATYPEEVNPEKEMIPAAGERAMETKALEKTILIVDDEKDSVEAVGYRLEANGYKILKAYNGEEALKIVETELPDLVISDIKMPVLDGYGLLKKMKENKRLAGIPLIFLSGKEREFEDRVDGITQGAVRYFLKPYDETDFLSTIKLVLKK